MTSIEKPIKNEKNEDLPALPAPTFWEKIIARRKIIIPAALIILAIAGGLTWVIKAKFTKPEPTSRYEVAVVVRSQTNQDPIEDRRTSLKSGDVLVVQSAGHSWSTTEKISYLILPMELTATEAAKLMQADEKEIKFKDLPAEDQQRIKDEEARAKKEKRDYQKEKRTETIRPRLYYIDLAMIGFSDPNQLLTKQPYMEKVFGWEVVKKKKSIK